MKVTEIEAMALIGIMKLKNSTLDPYELKRKQKSHRQYKVLEDVFEITMFPTERTKIDIGLLLGIPQRAIQVWFQNRRQRYRNEETGSDESKLENNGEYEQLRQLRLTDDISEEKLIEIVTKAYHIDE